MLYGIYHSGEDLFVNDLRIEDHWNPNSEYAELAYVTFQDIDSDTDIVKSRILKDKEQAKRLAYRVMASSVWMNVDKEYLYAVSFVENESDKSFYDHLVAISFRKIIWSKDNEW